MLGFLTCLNTIEKPKTAQHLSKNGEEGGFCLTEKLCLPFHWPGQAGRGSLPTACILVVPKFLHLEPSSTSIRITVLKLHQYHAIALLRELKPFSKQIGSLLTRHASLHCICRRILYQLRHQGSLWLHGGWKFCSDPGFLASAILTSLQHSGALCVLEYHTPKSGGRGIFGP